MQPQMKPDHPVFRLAERVIRALLCAYPAHFRARYRDDLLDTLRDRSREEWRTRGWTGLLWYCVRISPGIIRDGLGERLGMVSHRRPSDRTTDVIGSITQDLRAALRQLRRKPAFSIGVILTLALGMGANAAIFSMVDGVLLRALPYPEPEGLVRIWEVDTETGNEFVELSYADYTYIRDNSTAFTEIGAFSRASRDLVDDFGRPTEIILGRVTHGLFGLLGKQPIVGRDFSPDDAQRRIPVAILSHRLWSSRYGGRPDVIGQTVRIRTRPFTIVGVLPPASGYPFTADIWRPLDGEAQDEDRELHVLARLGAGVTVDQASAEVRLLAGQLQRIEPDLNETITAWAQPMQDMVVRDARTPLLVLLAAVGFVLMIACANTANLLLARGAARRQEAAIRTALGASRWRVARQLLTESLVLATFGGAVGLLAGYGALDAIIAVTPADTPRLAEIALDRRVIGVMAVVVLLAGVAFGTLPALHGSRTDLQTDLKGGARGWAGRDTVRRMQQSLVIAEVGLATVLAIGATLLIASFNRMLHLERGFTTENLLIVPISPGTLYRRNRSLALFDGITQRLGALPGVRSVVVSTMNPMSPPGLRVAVQIDEAPGTSADRPIVRWHATSPGFFRETGIAMRDGRALSDADHETAPPVVVINEAFARAHLGGEDPIGKRLVEPPVEIVGVVADITPRPGFVPEPTMFSPFRQLPMPGAYALLRTGDDPLLLAEAVREQVWATDPTIPLDDITSVERAIAASVAAPRFQMFLVSLFASLSLLLAAVGIYGVMSYAVAQRTRELGLRHALGAAEGRILRMVMREGVGLAAAGVALGLVAAFWLTRLLTALLYDVDATDPLIFGTAACVLAAVAAAACYLPARRAMRVDPMAALRYE